MGEAATAMAFRVIPWTGTLVFSILAVVTLWRGPSRRHVRLWAAYCLATAVHLLSMPLPTFWGPTAASEVVVRVSLALGCLDQFMLVLFAAAFAAPPRVERSIGAATGAAAAVLAALVLFTDLLVAGIKAHPVVAVAPRDGPAFGAYVVYVLASWIVPFVLIAVRLRRAEGLARTQLAYTLGALVFGLTGSVGATLPAALERGSFLVFLPFLMFPLFPLIITYATVRYRLLDIRTVIHRTTAWALSLVLLALPLVLLFHLTLNLGLDISGHWMVAVLVGLFVLGYLYLSRVKPRIDHLFQRRSLDRERVLDGFARSMSSLARSDDVARRVRRLLEDALYPDVVVVSFRLRGDGGWVHVGPAEVEVDERFAAALARHGKAVERGQLELDDDWEPVRAGARAQLTSGGARVCVPLVNRGRLLGLVHLGPKRNLRPYSQEDLEFLDRLGTAAAVGLSNALLFEQVDEQRSDLEALTHNLEEKVRERTAELASVNERLREANEGLKEMDRLKSGFFAGISHELRTPLTLILLGIRSLSREAPVEDDRDQDEIIADIRRSAVELLKLIDDLLDLTRLEESQLRLKVREMDLDDLAGEVLETARPLARRKDIDIELARCGAATMVADGDKLERILVNLLTNALKFTGPGGRVAVRTWREGRDVFVSVSDTGVGIPRSELGRVFDRFHQVQRPGGSRGGTGIGLALVRELAELHGGDVRVQSEMGRGSTFTVRIPADVDDLPPERVARPSAPPAGTAELHEEVRASEQYRFAALQDQAQAPPPGTEEAGVKEGRLLVVDDNADVLRYLQRLLSKRYDVAAVQDGEKAWRMLLEERHDLVISDVMMPGISGLDLCRRVKDDPRTQAVPVLLLTARDATEHRIEGHGVEADEYLTKPFDPAELFAAVAGLLAGRTRRAEVASRRRSESLRTLLGGMAHELRNATHQMRSAQAVMLALTRRAVEAEGATDAERRKRLEKLERMEGVMGRSLSRVTRVVSGIGHYAAGRMRDRWVVIDLDELVHREVSVLAPSLEGDVTLTTELAAGARIQGPEEEVRMTVINLVENAVKAVRGGGSVQVRTAERRGRVLLEVRDDGSGIPPERLESIFEPFFTTRDPGEGMGLGLALVKRVVEDVGGRISVHSRPGEGSLFTVSIPVYDAGGAAARGGGGGSGVRDKGEDDDYNDGLSEKAAET